MERELIERMNLLPKKPPMLTLEKHKKFVPPIYQTPTDIREQRELGRATVKPGRGLEKKKKKNKSKKPEPEPEPESLAAAAEEEEKGGYVRTKIGGEEGGALPIAAIAAPIAVPLVIEAIKGIVKTVFRKKKGLGSGKLKIRGKDIIPEKLRKKLINFLADDERQLAKGTGTIGGKSFWKKFLSTIKKGIVYMLPKVADVGLKLAEKLATSYITKKFSGGFNAFVNRKGYEGGSGSSKKDLAEVLLDFIMEKRFKRLEKQDRIPISDELRRVLLASKRKAEQEKMARRWEEIKEAREKILQEKFPFIAIMPSKERLIKELSRVKSGPDFPGRRRYMKKLSKEIKKFAEIDEERERERIAEILTGRGKLRVMSLFVKIKDALKKVFGKFRGSKYLSNILKNAQDEVVNYLLKETDDIIKKGIDKLLDVSKVKWNLSDDVVMGFKNLAVETVDQTLGVLKKKAEEFDVSEKLLKTKEEEEEEEEEEPLIRKTKKGKKKVFRLPFTPPEMFPKRPEQEEGEGKKKPKKGKMGKLALRIT